LNIFDNMTLENDKKEEFLTVQCMCHAVRRNDEDIVESQL